jgi:hypothetical protein
MFSFKPKKSEESCTSGCCTPQPKGKEVCPRCGNAAKKVLGKTLAHLLTEAAKAKLTSLEGFGYCKTPSCKVVYFRGEEVLEQDDLTVTVGLKEGTTPATVCYCFEWTKEKIAEELNTTGKTTALEDIKAKMEDPGCSCETLNPSGTCCLGDVGKAIREIEAKISV